MLLRLVVGLLLAVAVFASNDCADLTCNPGYSLYTGNCMCYKLSPKGYSFNGSIAYCAADKAKLPQILTPQQNDFLSDLIRKTGDASYHPWFGLTCAQSHLSSSCKWLDGTSLIESGWGNFISDVYPNSAAFMYSGPKQNLVGQWSTSRMDDNSGSTFCEQNAVAPRHGPSARTAFELLKPRVPGIRN